jgi:hypothetical protein
MQDPIHRFGKRVHDDAGIRGRCFGDRRIGSPTGPNEAPARSKFPCCAYIVWGVADYEAVRDFDLVFCCCALVE